MPNVSMPEVPAVPTLQDFLPPPPPCPDPANCDCFGAWSICSAACETAAERVWTLGRPATGSGVACPPATNCGMFGLQDGECAAKPYNASACFDKDGNPCPPPPVGFAATIVRLLPMASAMFVAYFGTRISTMVRVFSVFWASAAPTLIPTMMQIKQEGSLSAATFVGIGGAFYAGGLGSFAAVKKREFGIMVQGVALGYIVTSIAQGYVLGAILEAAPGAKAYLEWITMVFTFSVGGAIGKFSQKYEDIVSVAATAVMGAYAQLQTFASLGFTFTRGLSVEAAIAGEFGCKDWPCQLTLTFFILYALGGVRNQVMMNRMNKLLEENPDYEGDSAYQKLIVRLNKSLEIVFQLNELVKEAGKHHTPEELEELLEKNISIIIKLTTVFSDVGMLVLAVALFAGVIEGFARGCFWGTPLQLFALALALIGIAILSLVIFAIKTHMLPMAELGRRHYRMKWYLLFVALLMPVVFACGVVVVVMLPGSSVSIPQVQRFFDMDKLPPDVQDSLSNHLPTVSHTLTGTLFTLATSWSIVCRHLGGILYLAMKLTSMVTSMLFVYGLVIAFAGFWGAQKVGLLEEVEFSDVTALGSNMTAASAAAMDGVHDLQEMDAAEVTLFHLLGAIGASQIVISLVGMIGMKVYYKVRALGCVVLRVFNVLVFLLLVANTALFAVVAYWSTQIDDRIDDDWAKMEDRFGNSSSWDFFIERVGSKGQFVETLKGSFTAMMIFGGVICFALLLGVVASHFVIVTDNPLPAKAERQADKPKKLTRKEKKEAKKNDTRTKAEKKADKRKEKAAKKEAKQQDKEKKLAGKQDLLKKEKEKKKEKKKAKMGVGDGEAAKSEKETVDNPVADGAKEAFEKEKKGDKKKKKKKKGGKGKGKKQKGGGGGTAEDDAEKGKLLELWKAMDADGSGTLDRGEVRACMESMGKKLSDKEFDSAMAEIDADNSGEVSFEEFLEWWQRQDPEAQKQLMMLNSINFDFGDEV